jgi:hypothetical protein
MTIEEAYDLIENRDYPDGLKRKFAPSFSLVHINRNKEITSVLRFKTVPTEQQQLEAIHENRGCIQLSASPGMYSSVSELRERIEGSMWLFDKMKSAPT